MKVPRLVWHYNYEPITDLHMMILKDHANNRAWSFNSQGPTMDEVEDMMPYIIKRFYERPRDKGMK